MTSYISRLPMCLDLERVSQIDERACEKILGSNYLSVLKYWGVWDVVPLVSKGAIGQWQIPLIEHNPKSGPNALTLLAKSYDVWMSSDYQRTGVSEALDDKANQPWLEVSAGAVGLVEPSKAYLGVVQGNVRGFPVIDSDSVSLLEKSFLDKLGVRSVDQTFDLEKLIGTLENIAHGCRNDPHISGAIRSVYRQLIKQINRVLLKSEHRVSADLLDRIPLFYEESKSRRRGIAGQSDRVWYIPEAFRKTRTKIGDGEHYFWLANGDLGTLATRLDRVHQVSLKSPITVSSEFIESDSIRRLFENEYLPNFLAFACYGDVPGLAEVDESTLQKRWQTLVVWEGEYAQQDEKLGTDEVELRSTSTLLSEAQLLWEPLRPDSKRNLTLYVSRSADHASRKFRHRICDWFADEVFRRPQLAVHFKQIVDSAESLDVFELSDNAVADARAVIEQWLPEQKLESLISRLSEVTGVEISKANWRDQTLLKNCGMGFDDIKKLLPGEFRVHLSPLNPESVNEIRLLNFVSHHLKQLAATDAFGDFDESQWISLIHSDPVRFRYDFDPLQWILTKLGITEEEFNGLMGRLDGELRKSEREAEELGLKPQIAPISELDFTKIKPLERPRQYPDRIFEVSPEEERITAQLNRSRSGKLAEKLSTIHAAKRASALGFQEQKKLLDMVGEEYSRLSESNSKLLEGITFPQLPCTEEEWQTILHLANRWDGLGYDYLDFDQYDGQLRLLLVEMKSSRQDQPSIHLSENERLCLLKYTDEQFRTTYPSVIWKLLLQTGTRMVDATDFVTEVVREHAEAF
ncbi:hypothetical protein, partial [Marinobacter salarius]